MEYSTRERSAHAARRLGLGGQPTDELGEPDEVITQMLDLSSDAPPPPEIEPPADVDAGRDGELIREGVLWWLEHMVASPRPVEERMVWFWHDHFATSVRKVNFPYLMWRQHLTLRRHAVGNFADLLLAIATDPAMLIYLDGRSNTADSPNENFGREVLELFTVGHGHYNEDDVLAATAAFSGWKIAIPRRRIPAGVEPWESVFIGRLHDSSSKTLLGVTGRLDAAAAVDAILEHRSTAESIAAKVYLQLVGRVPDDDIRVGLGNVFRRDWSIVALVTEIAGDPVFLDAASINTRVRTPLEKALGILRGFPTHQGSPAVAARALERLGYQPWNPPNVAGFPTGPTLLSPYRMVHSFDLAAAIPPPDVQELDSVTAMERLGIADVSAQTLAVLDQANSGWQRAALAINSPEHQLA